MLIRPIREPDDRAAIDAVVATAEAGNRDGGLSEAKHMDLDRGATRVGTGFVVEADGRLMGYAHALPIAKPATWAIEVVIEPAAAEVAAYRLATEAALGAVPEGVEVDLWVRHAAHYQAAVALGFEPVRELLRMGRPLPAHTAIELPDRVVVRAFRPGIDEEAWLGVNNAAFAEHPENRDWDADRLAERMKAPWFDPEGLLMGWADETAVGFCWTKVHPDGVGEIYIIGVHPSYGHRGLGRALSLAGLAYLHDERQVRRAILYCDANNLSGLAMYQHLGFERESSSWQFVATG